MNTIIEEDFRYISNNSNIPWDLLNGKTILITGATGFLGSLLIRFFSYLNNVSHRNIKLIALVRNTEKARRLLGDNIILIQGDIRNIPQIPFDINFIIHCAAETDSRKMIENPVEVSEGIVLGTINILKLAYQKGIESAVYVSSMEVYGLMPDKTDKVDENDCGIIDIMNARSCYPMGKRMAENLCFNYFYQYGLPVKIARLAQTFGAGILETDNRVFAQFARSVINKKNIVLHTDGSSIGNYCYSADAILGLILILLNGTNGQAYNVVNEESTMTIRQMAELVATRVAGGSIAVKYEIPETNIYGYAIPSQNKLSSDKLRSLGWVPMYGMEDMYIRMIGYLSDIEHKQLNDYIDINR
jgi:nucleoside-diphosphate-sugar epimerase